MVMATEALCGIIVDENGNAEFIGKSGMELTTGTSLTGAQKGEQNGYNLVLSSQEREFAPKVPDTILSAIQAGEAVPAL